MFYSWSDTIFRVLFPIAFLCCLGIFLFTLVSNLRNWNQNNHAPKLSVPAAVVAKRTQISHSNMANAGDMTGTHGYTIYYVTFQVESGDRMEFAVSGAEYGMLAEGDIGKLIFQGTRYLGFARR